MGRRVSSKDDVFLSAIDLWSLLLFSFIGLSFLARHGESTNEQELNLPVIPELHAPASSKDNTPVVFLSWEGDADLNASKDGQCHVIARFGSPRAEGERLDMPCWPMAFEGTRTDYNARLRLSAEKRIRAVIVCPVRGSKGGSAIEACSRLHWLAAETGFDTAVAVSSMK